MKEIQLTQGHFAKVDDLDFDWLSQFKWHFSSSYAATSHGKRPTRTKVSMHKLIMDNPKGMMVDHINGDKLDNRRINLRIVTNSQNQMNAVKQKKNGVCGSEYKGVTKNKPWRAAIGKKTLGYFESEIEAAEAYDAAAKIMYGEHAKLNFKYPTNQ